MKSWSKQERVCPKGMYWFRMYKLLPVRSGNGGTEKPPLPHVLDAWVFTCDDTKARRFREHMEWARNHDALHRVNKFLDALPEEAWHHWGEVVTHASEASGH